MTGWHRKLWAIQITGSDRHKFLIGNSWINLHPSYDIGQVPHPALFDNRREARLACAQLSEKHAHLRWKFRVVRVVETVKEIKHGRS